MPSKSTNPPTIVYVESPCPRPDLKGPCHIYSRGKCAGGYGAVTVFGKKMLVHRYVWELANGPIPKGLMIDHQCMVRACCNVDHLRVVTHAVNITENSRAVGAINKAKTHCIRGHPLFGDNMFIAKKAHSGKGSRVCRICWANSQRAYRERRAAGIPPGKPGPPPKAAGLERRKP